MPNEMIPIGGLWRQKREGKPDYLSGYLGRARLYIFVNDRKEPGSNTPDYQMYVAKPAEQRKAEEKPAATSGSRFVDSEGEDFQDSKPASRDSSTDLPF